MESAGTQEHKAASSYLLPPGLCFLDDDDDDEVPLTGIRPKCSPLPKRRSSECLDDCDSQPPPSGTRKVSFADTFGLSLVAVKHFSSWDVADCSSGFLEGKTKDTEQYFLSCLFATPLPHEELHRRVEEQKLELESLTLLPGTTTLRGVVHVLNICYSKTVYVRMSLDLWKSHFDLLAEFTSGSTEEKTDCFTFNHTLVPQSSDNGVRLDFCLRCETDLGTFWANNGGNNYIVFFHNNTRAPEQKDIHIKESGLIKKSCLKSQSKFSSMNPSADEIPDDFSPEANSSVNQPLKTPTETQNATEQKTKLLEEKKYTSRRRRHRRAAKLAQLQECFTKRETDLQNEQERIQQTLYDDKPSPQNESSNGQLPLKEQTHTPPAAVFSVHRRSTPPPGGAEMCSNVRSGSYGDTVSQKGSTADQTNDSKLVSTANDIQAISKDQNAEIKTKESALQWDKSDKKMHYKSEDASEIDGPTGENIRGTLKENSRTDCTNLSQSSLYTFETVVAPLYHEIFTQMDTRRKAEMELKNYSKHEKVDELNSLASTQRDPQITKTMPNVSEHKNMDNLLPSNDKKVHSNLAKNAICQRTDTKQEELGLEKTSILCLPQKTELSQGTSSIQQIHSLSETPDFYGVQKFLHLPPCYQDIMELQANSILGHQSYTAEITNTTNTDKEHIQPHMTIISDHSETPIDYEVQSRVSEDQVSGPSADSFTLDPHRSPRTTQCSAGCLEGTENADGVEEDPNLLLSQSDNFTALGGIKSTFLDATHIQSQTQEDGDDIQTQTGENTLNDLPLEPMSPDSRDKTVTIQNKDCIKAQISDLIPTQLLETVPVESSKETQWMTPRTAEKTLNLHAEKCETAENNENGVGVTSPKASPESSCPHNVSENITIDSFTSLTFIENKNIKCELNRAELHGNGDGETETLDDVHRCDSIATEVVIPDECRHDYSNSKLEQLESTFKEICYSPDNILLPTNLSESPVPPEIQCQENPTLTQTSNKHKTVSFQSTGTTNTQLVYVSDTENTTDKTQVPQADNDFTISESGLTISEFDIRCVQTQGIADATCDPSEEEANSRSLNQTKEDTVSERQEASAQPITSPDVLISEDNKATLCNHLILNPTLHSTHASYRHAIPSDEERPEQTISVPLHSKGVTSIRSEQQSPNTTERKDMEGEMNLTELPGKKYEASEILKDLYEFASRTKEETELAITDTGQQCFEGENPKDCGGLKLDQTESNLKEVPPSPNNSLLAGNFQQNLVTTENQGQEDKAPTQTSKKDEITSLQIPGTTNTPLLHISDIENTVDKSQVLQAPRLPNTTNFKAKCGENCKALKQTKKDSFGESAEANTSPDVSIPEDTQDTSCNKLILAQTLHTTHTSHKNVILTDDEKTVLKSKDAEHSKYLQKTGIYEFVTVRHTDVEHRPDESTSVSSYEKEMLATKPEQHKIVPISSECKDTQSEVYVAELHEKNDEETKIPNDGHKSDNGVHKETEPAIHDESRQCFEGQSPNNCFEKELPYLPEYSLLAANFQESSVATQGQEDPTLTQTSNKDVITSFHTPGTTNIQQLQISLKENTVDKNQVLQTDNDLTFPESSLPPTTYFRATSEENSRPLVQTKKDLSSERQEKMAEVFFHTKISDNKDLTQNHLTPIHQAHVPDKNVTQTADENTSIASENVEQYENLHVMEQYKTSPKYCGNHSDVEERLKPSLPDITNNEDITSSAPEQHTSLVSTDGTDNPNEECKAEAKEGTNCPQTDSMNESYKDMDMMVPSTDFLDLTLALLQTSTGPTQLTNVDMQEEREKESNKQESAELTAVAEDVYDGEEQSETWSEMMAPEYDADYTSASTDPIHSGSLENTADEAEIGVDSLLALTGQEDMDVNRHLPMMDSQTLNKLEKHTFINVEKAVEGITKYCESTEKEHKAYHDNSGHDGDYLYCSADSVWLAYDNYHILETSTGNIENISETSTGNIGNISETSTGNVENILETSGNIQVFHEAGEKNVAAEGKVSYEAKESEHKQLGNEHSKEMSAKDLVSVEGTCSQIKDSSELDATVCEMDYGGTPEEQVSGMRESSLIGQEDSESPDDLTGSVSDDEMELYMHALRAAQKSEIKDFTGSAKKEASLPVFKRSSLSKSGGALPSITESLDEENQITAQTDEQNASPQLIRNPALDSAHEDPNTGEENWEQWRQTLSLDNVSRVLVCVLMFVLFIVTAHYYDFMACFVLYIFTAYWLCCQKETTQIK